MEYTIMDELKKVPVVESTDPEYNEEIEDLQSQLDDVTEEKDKLEEPLSEYGDGEIIKVETGLGVVVLTSPNLRLTHELEAFAEALAAKYGGRVL